jgi:NAD(P)-dependent dehydrogenase (short-subunit alcohol dehydrogenase family)
MFTVGGKVALITGGGGGLGRVFCETLAEYGADVALVDVDAQGAEETAARVRQLGRETLAIAGDVSRPDDVAQMVAATVERFGRIDILVCNAGVSAGSNRVADTPLEEWDRVMGVNLRGTFLSARACLPVMVAQGAGNIITVASILGVRPFPAVGGERANFPYGVAKAGVIRLTKEIAADYAADGIRANCMAPGWHEGTQLSSRWKRESDAFGAPGASNHDATLTAEQVEACQLYEEGIAKLTPMGRKGHPSELRGLLLYLASDASSFMTGQVLISDGGVCV